MSAADAEAETQPEVEEVEKEEQQDEAAEEEAPEPIPPAPPAPPAPPVQKKQTAAAVNAAPESGGARKAQRTHRIKINAPAKQAAKIVKEPVSETAGAEYDDYIESDTESDEPSKVLACIMSALKWCAGCFKRAFQCFQCVFALIMGIVPVAFNVGFFFLVVYLTATYLVTPADERQVHNFTLRLRYLARGHAWTMFPAVLGMHIVFKKRNY